MAFSTVHWPQEVYFRFQMTGMIKGNFMGLNFSISGLFLEGKIGKYFLGRLGRSRVYFGYSKPSEDSW